jgi:tRNA(Ile)-lysidine synthase
LVAAVTPETFERLMAPFRPFETNPHIAVGVSGGGDSMALALLADAWARAHGGHITALGVDHGLRPGSVAETDKVAGWLAARGIAYQRLSWVGPKPDTGIQDAARQARYRLLEDWCRQNAVLHLLIAHNLEDQAETLMIRLGRGSGPDGLAAMSAARELTHCRLLRPLLSVHRETLRRYLEEGGQPWVEDPSNADPRFTRPRVRRQMAAGEGGAEAVNLAESARRYGLARVVLERETDRLLARSCRFDGAGFANLVQAELVAAPEDLAVRALGRVISAVGGLTFPPRRARIERLLGELAGDGQLVLTLGRCQIAVVGGRIDFFRERRNAPEPVAHQAGGSFTWDRRYDVVFGAKPRQAGRNLALRALDLGDWETIQAECPALCQARPLPQPALWGLPALADEHGVFSVPHLKYLRGRDWPGMAGGIGEDGGFGRVRFSPAAAASAAGFQVV